MVDAEARPGHSAGLGMTQEASTRGSELNGPPKPRTSITLDFRQEPGAGKPHAGICGGGAGKPVPLPDSRESHSSRVPTLLSEWKATRAAASSRVAARPGVVEDPGTHAHSLHGNREISRPAGPPQAAPVRIGKVRSRSR